MFLKDSISYLLNKATAGIVALLAVLVFTRILTPEEYAIYSISISAMNILYATFFLWLSLSFTKFYEVYRYSLKALYSSVFFGFVLISFSLFFLKLFFQKIPILKSDFDFSYILFFMVISYAWFDLCSRIANVNQQTTLYGKLVRYRALLGFFLGLVFYYYFGVSGIFAALILSSLVPTVLLLKSLSSIASMHKIDVHLLKLLLKYGLPLTITSGLTLIVDFSDRFLISGLSGHNQSGIYSASYDFVLQTLGFLIGIFYLSFFPLVNKLHENKEMGIFKEQLSYYANILFVVSFPIGVAYICLADGFSNVFLGVPFRMLSSSLIPVITVGVLLGNLKAYLIDLVFYLHKKTLLQVLPSILVASVNIALNLLWIPKFGPIGAAYATLISFFLGIVLSGLIAWRYRMLPKLNADTYQILLATSIMFLYLLVIAPGHSYGMITFLAVLISALLVYLGTLWHFDTLKLKSVITGNIKKYIE